MDIMGSETRAPTITEGAFLVNDLACKTLPVYFFGGTFLQQ